MRENNKIIRIGEEDYIGNQFDEFEIPFSKLNNLSLNEMPFRGNVNVSGFNIDIFNIHFRAKHENSHEGNFNLITFMIIYKAPSEEEAHSIYYYLKSYLKNLPIEWELDTVMGNPFFFNNEYGISYSFEKNQININKPIKEYFEEALEFLKKLKNNTKKVFLCHSSEDKKDVELVANELKKHGAKVWFDKWEIKIGDSIVERIDEGLSEMTHLLIFFSKSSIEKPWVKKELSSGLMRKLNNHSIKIMPILLNKVQIPTILLDLKYADLTINKKLGIIELMNDL